MRMFSVRFWNIAGENIKVGGKYMYEGYSTFMDAWESANALLKSAVKNGAVEMDINNKFYQIINE